MSAPSFLVIGGGIIGSAIARELATRKIGPVTVIEKEERLGEHASGRNSGVLHSGINQKPGSMKARMAVEGNRRARWFCRERGVRMEECGTLVIARDRREEEVLERLLAMGKEAGVRGLRIIGKKELHEREPAIVAGKALYSPTGSIVDSAAFLRAVAHDARDAGARFAMNAEVRDIRGKTVATTAGDFSADHIVNCAGLHADTIAHMMGVGREFVIIPFRGDYREIRNIRINSMVYQAPDLRYPFLGVHFTKTVDGKVLAGPTATLAFGREAYAGGIDPGETLAMLGTRAFRRLVTSREFIRLVWHNAKVSVFASAFLDEVRALAPSIAARDIRPWRSGIRAQMVDRRGRMVDDLVVRHVPGSTHVLNAVSPGMTSALAFAEHVANDIVANCM